MNNIFRITGVVSVIICGVFLIDTVLANESQNRASHGDHSHEHEKPTNESTHDHEHVNDKGNSPEKRAVEESHEEGISLSAEKIELAGIKIDSRVSTEIPK